MCAFYILLIHATKSSQGQQEITDLVRPLVFSFFGSSTLANIVSIQSYIILVKPNLTCMVEGGITSRGTSAKGGTPTLYGRNCLTCFSSIFSAVLDPDQGTHTYRFQNISAGNTSLSSFGSVGPYLRGAMSHSIWLGLSGKRYTSILPMHPDNSTRVNYKKTNN